MFTPQVKRFFGSFVLLLVLAGSLALATPAFAQKEVWANNATSTLASGINNSVTSLTVATGTGSRFPTITGSDFFYATLVEGTTIEIVKVTARASDVFTVVRAQCGTSAASFTTAAKVENRATSCTFQGLQAVTTATLSMAGETSKRFTISDAAVSTSSKIFGTIRRPDVTESNDEGWQYGVNIVSLGAGTFDVVVFTEDPDDDFRPTTETVTFVYIVR